MRVTTAAESAARDQAAIASGIASFELMARAGAVAAAVLLRDFPHRLADGVVLHAGAGNNGGDAYVVAAELARAGVSVRLRAVAPPKTPDAQRAAALAAPLIGHATPTGTEGLAVDGLLGTGQSGPLRPPVQEGCAQLQVAKARGAFVVALDLPTGLDATTGEIADGAVPADCTISFGTFKRGALLQRALCGRLLLADIGLGAYADGTDNAWCYTPPEGWRALLPPIAWNAHKGTRGRLALVGGQRGMAGAMTYATLGALGAGAGLVRIVCEERSIPAVQSNVPQAVAESWEAWKTGVVDDAHPDHLVPEAFGAVAVGPGLGRTDYARMLLEHALWAYGQTPLLLDADALYLLALSARAQRQSAASLLAAWAHGSPGIVCTPHPKEFAQLTGEPIPATWESRADQLLAFAQASGTTVLLKGAPTLIASPHSARCTVVPHGTAMLATGGSGDLLTGIITTLLAQEMRPEDAAALGATVHGLAAECATEQLGGIRGGTLAHVEAALPRAWRRMEGTGDPVFASPPGVVATLPSVEWSVGHVR